MMRIVVTLACSECRSRNYTTTKKREKRTQKMGLRKYCKRCRKHTIHKETR